MFHTDELEMKIQKHDIAIKRLAIDIENIQRHNNELFSDLNVTSDQISAFISNKDHFTDENWDHLREQKKQLDEKLHRELSNIRNPAKTKKNIQERGIPQHWMFVR